MKMLNYQEIVAFCSQLALILKAGISSVEGIDIMKEDSVDAEGREILSRLQSELEYSGQLHDAMRAVGVFPEYVCSMTEIGEQTGRLDEVMEGLSGHYEREEELRRSLKSALAYPLIMLGMMTAVVLVLVIQVMPIFQQVFESLGGGLTGISAGVMRLGVWISRYSIVFVLLLAAMLLTCVFLIFTKKGKACVRHMQENSRLSKNLTEKLACSKVAGGMDLCLRSGLDIDQSLELTRQLIRHRAVREKVEECQRLIREGESFDHAVSQSGLFSGIYARMVGVGIRTGSVDQVMHKVARQYEEEVTEKLYGTISMVEPTIVAILSVLVGLILLSVMLPLMSIMSGLG
ncbi:MAG: type II secretion system F family protein [Eubacteriales bacterium]|nr:type II secretion system F family protein [Eubacteriales bacterium]